MRKIGWVLLVIMTLLGCSKKSPVSPALSPSKIIVAEFNRQRLKFPYPGDWGSYYESVSVYTDSTPDPVRCSAWMKFGSQAFWLSQKWVKPGGLEVRDSIFFPYPGVTCSLLVSIGADTSRGGGVSLPGSYKIYAPGQGDTMAVGNVTISWSQSQFASWYDLYLSCQSFSRLGGDVADTVLIATSPSAAIPLSFFQRDTSAVFWDIQVSIHAHGGIPPSEGANGNLSGTIKGTFYSTFEDTSGSREFYMGTPPFSGRSKPHSQLDEQKRKRYILRAFSVPVK